MKLDFTRPVTTRDGRKVRILCTDRTHPYFPVVGLVSDDDGREPTCCWTLEGKAYQNLDDTNIDLVQDEVRYVNVYQDETYVNPPSTILGPLVTLKLTLRDGKVVEAEPCSE